MEEAPPIPAVLPDAPAVETAPAYTGAAVEPAEPAAKPYCEGWMVNMGWANTVLALSISGLPFKYLLKDQLHLDPEALSRFMLLANIPIYVKPFAGILSDALPFCGTRRRHYLLLSLTLGSLLWLLLGLVPRTFGSLVWTFIALNIFLTLTSTVLGGLMVEVGKRQNMTGGLSAQRHGITQLVGIISGPVGGYLAKLPFMLTASLCAFFYWITAPIYFLFLKEPANAKRDTGALLEVGRQGKVLLRSHTLWAAAGLVVLVVAAPGFGTPLFYHQTNVLKFSPEFLGWLAVIAAASGVVAAYLYSHFCRRLPLRLLLGLSIAFHAAMTLLYLFYHTPWSARIITGLEAATMVFALLPLYDLSARATPRGSEALGYCVMMSVWNFTSQFSDYVGSWLNTHWQLTFSQLVWVNSGTTALVLIAVPFLPSALMDRRDGEPEAKEGKEDGDPTGDPPGPPDGRGS